MSTTDVLDISPDLALPRDAVTQTFALLAVRRAGKSTAAAVMAEEMYRLGLPWTAIDPKGDWWGMRSSADGTGPGLPVPIFGGLHGDMPLIPESGRMMAELIVEHNLTCILDVSRFSKAARIRFLTAFGERLYELHQAEPQARHLFLEEADRMLPQRVMADMAACVGAYTDLVRLGGAFGLGATLISQRSAVVNKDCLTQVETMIAMRNTSPQDRKAIRDWMEHHAIVTEVVDSLPTLVSGEAWVSSSFWLAEHGLKAIQRIRFRRRETFDSGATPTVGEGRRVATIADIDLGALQGRMDEVVERAEQNDPAALRRRIAELERRLRDIPAPAELGELRADNADLRTQLAEALARPAEPVEVSVLTPGDRAAVDQMTATMRELADQLDLSVSRASRPAVAARPTAPVPAPPAPAVARAEPLVSPPAPDGATNTPTLKSGARAMLTALARTHPLKVTRAQLGALSKFKASGGTFRSYLSTLRLAGLIEDDGQFVILTDAGLAAAGGVHADPLSTSELRDTWRSALKIGARTMLDILIDRYPESLSRAELAELAEFEVAGGTFRSYLSTLRVNALIEETGDGIRAAEVFFLGAVGA